MKSREGGRAALVDVVTSRPPLAAAVESTPGPATTTAAPSLPLESTVRALITGCGIGAVLAAGNVYTGLKTSFIDGGSITAALLGFMLFSTFKRLARTPYGVLENNITQTTASSAAIMGFAVGVAGPIPALALMGTTFPGWAIAVLGTALALLGIFAAILLRRRLVVEDALPFPTGAATAEVLETIHAARKTAMQRARLLLGAGAVAMLVTWFRDGRPAFIPQTTAFGLVIGGVATSAWNLGVSWSPLMFSTGAMLGMRTAVSMLVGGTLSWAVLAPWLVRSGIVREAGFGPCSSWLVWPGLGLLVAGSFVPLLLEAGTVLRSFRDLAGLVTRRAEARREASRAEPPSLPSGAMVAMLLASVVVIVLVGRGAFGLYPVVTVLAVLLALVLANVSGRAAGETDLAPVGAVGMLTQLAFAGYGSVVSIIAGWVSMGSSSQTAQTLWAFRAGHRLGASPRAQIGGQLLGALLGGAVVVPVYLVIAKSYGIGTETMPAIGAMSWRATAEAVRGGLGALPQHGPVAGALGLGVGIMLTLLGRTRLGRFAPSPAAMGVAMLNPASLSVAAFTGAVLVVVARRLRPGLDEPSVMAVAAGGIAGESVMGVIVAILIATGVL